MSNSDSHSLRHVLAKNIRTIRNNLNYNQETLAEEAGLHRTYIGSVERSERNISIDNIEKIAHALGVPAFELLKSKRN